MYIRGCGACCKLYTTDQEFCSNYSVPEDKLLDALMEFITQFPEHKASIDNLIESYYIEFHQYTDIIAKLIYSLCKANVPCLVNYQLFLQNNYPCGKKLILTKIVQ